MHKRLVIHIVSRIFLIVCFFMLLPLGWAVHDDWRSLETGAFVLTILFGVFVTGALRWASPAKKKDYEKLNAKDGLAIVGFTWIFLSAFGALPLCLSQVVPSYTDAFFEITSGFTTTGSTIFTDIEVLPRGILFWRSLTHWIGGMGIIVLYLALLPALGQNAFQLFKAESPGLTAERIQPRIKETAKVLWMVYFLLSATETGFLMLAGMPVFDALCHTFGTMATGGFSTKNASMAAYGPHVQWIVILFMFLAGTNFILHYQAMKGNIRSYFKSEEFRNYFFATIGLVFVFTVVLSRTQLTTQPFRDSFFQVVAILTTTGYTTADFDLWPHALQFALIILMFVGGCGGSTGGGMKVVRFLVSIKVGFRSIVQTIFPNAVLPIKFEGAPLSDRLISGATAYFIIFISLFLTGTMLFTITENCDLVTAFSASIAALSNIGPGLGKVGATQNYAWVSVPGKWVLTFLMLAGRLELYSILILFVPDTWKK